jgi:hypothetical protein
MPEPSCSTKLSTLVKKNRPSDFDIHSCGHHCGAAAHASSRVQQGNIKLGQESSRGHVPITYGMENRGKKRRSAAFPVRALPSTPPPVPLTKRSSALASELRYRAALSLSLSLYAYTGTPARSSLSELTPGRYSVLQATCTLLDHAHAEDLRS